MSSSSFNNGVGDTEEAMVVERKFHRITMREREREECVRFEEEGEGVCIGRKCVARARAMMSARVRGMTGRRV